jgi:hypothetical protein
MQNEQFGAAPAKDSFTLSPTSPAEAPKPPWRPSVVGRIAFFFGPVAGALIALICLRRMENPQKSKKVMRLAVAFAVLESLVLFFIPDVLSRFVAIGAEIAFLLFFPAFLEKDFAEWQAAHPTVQPSNGWNAVGWGFLGAIAFVAIAILVSLPLALMFPRFVD